MGCASSNGYQRKPVKTLTSHPVKELASRLHQVKPDIINFGVVGKTRNLAEFIPEDRQIIRKTWKYMEPNMTQNGIGVFERIFEYSPEIKDLYDIRNVPIEEVAEHPIVRGHAARFMNAVGATVDNLEHLDDTLTHILVNLGKAHRKFPGFDSDYFDTFYMAMTAQWETVMGVKFTREVADAWAHLFAFIMEKLKEGYYNPDE